jgi:hypothetical protein
LQSRVRQRRREVQNIRTEIANREDAEKEKDRHYEEAYHQLVDLEKLKFLLQSRLKEEKDSTVPRSNKLKELRLQTQKMRPELERIIAMTKRLNTNIAQVRSMSRGVNNALQQEVLNKRAIDMVMDYIGKELDGIREAASHNPKERTTLKAEKKALIRLYQRLCLDESNHCTEVKGYVANVSIEVEDAVIRQIRDLCRTLVHERSDEKSPKELHNALEDAISDIIQRRDENKMIRMKRQFYERNLASLVRRTEYFGHISRANKTRLIGEKNLLLDEFQQNRTEFNRREAQDMTTKLPNINKK